MSIVIALQNANSLPQSWPPKPVAVSHAGTSAAAEIVPAAITSASLIPIHLPNSLPARVARPGLA
ncbi:hypothetical protein [Undibacterium sp. Tian12W]|uniref:hypothetical protein n=1 Tax=Undibacterium sp. Tian12W TaxID=3413054 RepID=UPI003BF027BF